VAAMMVKMAKPRMKMMRSLAMKRTMRMGMLVTKKRRRLRRQRKRTTTNVTMTVKMVVGVESVVLPVVAQSPLLIVVALTWVSVPALSCPRRSVNVHPAGRPPQSLRRRHMMCKPQT
jgi:hypothetical protein